VSAARSWLFVPGDRPDRFDKAMRSGADQVIVDLEDAVAPDRKPRARGHVVELLARRHAYVRINGADTEWFAADLAALVGCPGLRGVVVPKTDTVADVARVAGVVRAGVAVVALIETALGVCNAECIAAAEGTARLAFGNLDFSLDTDTERDSETLCYARSRLVVASRAARIAAPLDGVSTELDDPGAIARDARSGRGLGFGGKLCIHSRQVAVVNTAYSYGADQIAWARRVVEASGASGGAAVRVDGQMIDKPRLSLARRIVAAG
jgi:citrate lyase beta subunit